MARKKRFHCFRYCSINTITTIINKIMREFIEKKGVWIAIGFLAGALAIDYLNYYKAKDKGYAKVAGFFKYTPGAENTL